MSAIAAIYNLDNKPVHSKEIESVLNCLKHRGNDDRGLWVQGSVGLGHGMLWTTPESLHEKIPFQGAKSNCVITCDSRIDNRDELVGQLSFGVRPNDEITDSEIVLAAYENWGVDCVSRLIGDFVFAIWDEREQSLFAARDPLGIKHFYYFYKPGRIFALASEIKALLKIEDIPGQLNEESLTDYLVINTADKEHTLYKDVLRLPSAHALIIRKDGLRKWEYWKPYEKEVKLRNASEYQEAFREKLSMAVECRLRSAYPVGSTLSGGLDSSAVVCIASNYLERAGREPLRTFSGIFPTVAEIDPRIDELRYMRSVIEKSGCQPHFVNVDEVNPLRNMDQIIHTADHPAGYLNLYMASEIYKAAESQNVRILLGGHDGDCTVSYGYEDFELLARRGRFLRMLKEAIALNRNIPAKKHSLKNLAWKQGLKPAIPSSLRSMWRILNRRGGGDDKNDPPAIFPLQLESVNQEFRSRTDLRDRLERSRRSAYPDGISRVEYHWRVLTSGLASILHEVNENLAGARGIELHHPFYDRRLIEFCINLPPGQRLYRGWTRSIFRFSMQGILPPDVQWRTTKANLGAHIKINLFKYESDSLNRFTRQNFKPLERFIDPKILRSAFESCQTESNRKDAEVMLILTSIYLSKWMEQSGFAK